MAENAQKTTFSDILRNIFYIILIFAVAPPLVQQVWGYFTKLSEAHTSVAWVEINDTFDDSEPYVKQLKKHFADAEVKAILLRIESPGAVSGSAQALFSEILQLKKEHPKPILALVENTCASGAYWVACAADHIIASPVAQIGSVGVVIRSFSVKDLLEQYKVHYTPIATGEYKTAGDPFAGSTPEQRKMLEELTHQTYEQFTASIASRRPKLLMKEVNSWANGKVFIGAEAFKMGMIDELGTISTAEAWLKKHAPIEGKIEWIHVAPGSLWDTIMGKATQYYIQETKISDADVGKIINTIVARLATSGISVIS